MNFVTFFVKLKSKYFYILFRPFSSTSFCITARIVRVAYIINCGVLRRREEVYFTNFTNLLQRNALAQYQSLRRQWSTLRATASTTQLATLVVSRFVEVYHYVKHNRVMLIMSVRFRHRF